MVAWKVFFIDMSRLHQFYRIIAFIVLGILVLCGSFLYLRFRETFAVESESETPEPDDTEPTELPEADKKIQQDEKEQGS